jgi:hypothetical protein
LPNIAAKKSNKIIMIKKMTFTLALLISTATIYAQDVKKEAETVKTKMDAFASKTGSITKFIDTKLPILKTSYEGAETRIRKISNGSTSAFFYQIVKEGKYSNSTASIEYSDLLEVLKALKALKADVINDANTNPDYLENKFITVDGFQVGYYLSSGITKWFIKLEKYGSENTLFIDSGDTIEIAFTEAKNKIDELKK